MDDFIKLLTIFVDQIAEFYEELSDEETIEITNFLQQAISFITQQQQAPETVTPPAAPAPIQEGPFESSNVNGFRYNPDNKELLVQFHGPYPQAAGSVYSYKNVPKFIYDVFSRGAVGPKTSGSNKYHTWIKGVTPSLGGALNALIKSGGFQYSRLS